MKIEWYTIASILFLLAFMLYTIYRYFVSRDIYNEQRIGYRKIYYVYMLTVGSLFWGFKVFPAEDLATLGAFLVGVIVMDLFIFQTPDITKFMANEFKHDGGLVNQLRETEDSSIRMSQQLQFVNSYMPKRKQDLVFGENFDLSEEKFLFSTQSIVKQYGDTFGLNVIQFSLRRSSEDELEPQQEPQQELQQEPQQELQQEPQQELQQEPQQEPQPIQELNEEILKDIVDYLYKAFDLNSNILGMKKKTLVKKLKDQESVEFFKKKQGAVIFPYRGEYTDVAYYVYPKIEDDSEKRVNATGYDALLLINMLHAFDLYVKSKEKEWESFAENEQEVE
ncbi:type II toxin-antitoxin system SpoIISA family toxin [Exiguobacterium artemiae]|uniref:type II toxin-antitoxin system SpoIISA family toxin n=1 Tax=Exiguobacterium artemiae TaxID=340145 RepID=UPI00047EFCAA|nr:type II toxin-antitoxin system SpoIISA family toxin [Exiguobacterium sibiricum]